MSKTKTKKNNKHFVLISGSTVCFNTRVKALQLLHIKDEIIVE